MNRQMLRLTAVVMAAWAIAVPAHADAVGDAINAAHFGPERRFLNYGGHEFHVKPASKQRWGSVTLLTGQISHHLTWRPDDQVYYTILKDGYRVVNIDVRISRGGVPSIPFVPWIVSAVVSPLIGVPIPPDQVEGWLRAIGRTYDGSWESACTILISSIGAAPL